MKINWKLRFRNKVTLTAIILAVIAFIYQMLGFFGIVPKISESMLVELVGLVINILVTLGVLTDPTTIGVDDSQAALNYLDCKGKDDINE